MDKSLDYELYDQLSSEISCLHKKKVLWARTLKLSLPEGESTYGTMGSELLKSGHPQESLIPLKRAITINPHDYSARQDLVKALFELQKENEAFSSIKNALSLDPLDYFLHQLLIDTLEEKEKLQDLESFSKEIVETITDPKSVSIFYFYNAEVLISNNKYPEALVNFQKAFENNSPMKRHHCEAYGFALYHEGLFEEALIQFEHIQKLDPNDKPACNNIAHLAYCLGKPEKALEGFEYIIENGLEITSTYANFILVLLHLDQDEEVINKYKDLLQPHIISHREELQKRYNEELRVTQAILGRDNINEKTKEFNAKKAKGINILLSFFN